MLPESWLQLQELAEEGTKEKNWHDERADRRSTTEPVGTVARSITWNKCLFVEYKSGDLQVLCWRQQAAQARANLLLLVRRCAACRCAVLRVEQQVEEQPTRDIAGLSWLIRALTTLRPGLYWFPVFGRSMVAIPTSMQTLDIKRATVVDKNGNPIVVSGVVTFQVVDSVRAAFGNPYLPFRPS